MFLPLFVVTYLILVYCVVNVIGMLQKEMEVQDAKLEEAKGVIKEEEYVITCDDFHEVCRTCLLKTDDVRDPNVEIEDIKVVNLLESYAGIKINPDDDLPQNICNNCLTQFLQFHVFIENCQTNDLYLKQLLNEHLKYENPEGDNMDAPPNLFNSGDDVVDVKLSVPQIIMVNEQEKIAPEEISDSGDAPILHSALAPEEEVIEVEVQPTQSTLLKECLICTKICAPASQTKSTCKPCRKLNIQKERISKYICEFCGKEFERSCTLWNHRRLHTGRRKIATSSSNDDITCKYCGKYFKSSTRYNIHVKQKHEGEEEAALNDGFECKPCRRSYDSSAKLKKHEQNVHTNQKFLCPTCGKDFVRKVHLQTHLLVHTKQKNHMCQVCDKVFAQPNSLKVHMFGHTGEKPHKCLICGKSFSRTQSLDAHMAVHTGKKPFVCKVCNKGFRQSTHLKTHIRTHSGERPYSCQICEKSFTTSGSLTIHTRIHTKEKIYQCGVCSKSYTDLGNLKKHMKSHAMRRTEFTKIPLRNSV